MINGIKIWAEKITVVVIICIIIELILPNGKNKKYIKTVMSLLIVFTIISPIITKVQKNNIDLNKYLSLDSLTINSVETVAPLDTNDYIEDTYKEALKTDIFEKLKTIGFFVNNIDLKIETKDEKTYGTILEIKVEATKEEDDLDNNQIYIKKIVIGKKETNKLTQEEKQEIIAFLSNTYNLDYEKIEVR